MTASPVDLAHGVKALLLAAGVGSRLRPLTDATPKCLIPIAGRPLLDYWFDRLSLAGVRDVLINTHHHHDQVRAYLNELNRKRGFRVVEAHEPVLLGSAGTVRANRSWMDGASHCMIIYADNLSSVDLAALLTFHRSHDDAMTMMLFHAPEPSRSGIVELDGESRIVSFVEKPREPRGDLANAGVYVVTADAYREIADLAAFDFGFDVLPRFVGRMRGWLSECYHRDIGTHESLQDAERAAATQDLSRSDR